MNCWQQPTTSKIQVKPTKSQVSQADKNVQIKTEQNSVSTLTSELPSCLAVPANRDLNASLEGDIATSAGNWFQSRIVAGKKL